MEKKNVESGEILLEVKNLKKYYPVRTGFIKKTELKAVDDVSFFIRKGETLGIVGESGCGKTTLGRTVLRLEEPTSGDIIYEGESIIGKNMKEYRKKMQIVFQDPYASLDPRKTVSDIIGRCSRCRWSHERPGLILLNDIATKHRVVNGSRQRPAKAIIDQRVFQSVTKTTEFLTFSSSLPEDNPDYNSEYWLVSRGQT